MPVQASAVEVLMASLNRLTLPLYGTVHDEIILVVPNDEADTAAAELQAAMTDSFYRSIPCRRAITAWLVEVSTGKNWAEVH